MKLDKINLSLPLFNDIVAETLKGKGIGRILMNHALADLEVSGQIIDLGSGTSKASYNRFLKFKEPYQATYTDFYQSGENLVKLNLEEKFALADGRFDNILCFNALEHIYNYQNVLAESWRILKPGGYFIGATPFICDYHPSPNDYFRYSSEALEKMFATQGFQAKKIINLGFGPFTAGFSQWGNILPNRLIFNIIKLPLLLIHLMFDYLLLMFTKRFHNNYPLGYLFIFRKP